MKEETKKTKKFNKKYLMFGLPILCLALVAAAVLTYYAVFNVTLNVNQPVSFSDTLEQTIDGCNSGETCLGEAIIVSNDGDNPRVIKIVETSGSENVEVNYIGKLELTTKNTATWQPTEDKKATIYYTIVGEEFEFSGVPEGYTLIYYKDGVVGLEGRLENPQPVIEVVSAIGDLPQTDDANLDANYSQVPDEYEHSVGAKLWAVPTSSILGGNVLDWSQWNSFLYETDLVYSFANADNELIVPANSFLTFYPTFTPSTYLETGEYLFEFEIQ